MPGPTQQQWQVLVGNGNTGSESFTELEGLYEVPDFTPITRTTRNANTIDHARDNTTIKQRINRLIMGADLSFKCESLPGSVAQDLLESKEGDDEGINIQIKYFGSDVTYTWEFNVLVLSRTYSFSSANDESGQDEVTYNTKMNSTPTETKE